MTASLVCRPHSDTPPAGTAARRGLCRAAAACLATTHVELDEAVVLRAAAAGYQLRADAGGQPERDREPAATRCRSTAVETAAPPCNHPRPSPSPLFCVRWNRVSRERSGTSNEDGRAR